MPARLAAIRRALLQYGIEIQEPASGGSHYKATNLINGRSYVLPAHNGLRTEIPDKYIKGLCRALDIDPRTFIQSL